MPSNFFSIFRNDFYLKKNNIIQEHKCQILFSIASLVFPFCHIPGKFSNSCVTSLCIEIIKAEILFIPMDYNIDTVTCIKSHNNIYKSVAADTTRLNPLLNRLF